MDTMLIVTVFTFYGSSIDIERTTINECNAVKHKIRLMQTKDISYGGNVAVECIKVPKYEGIKSE